MDAVKPSVATEYLVDALKARLVPMIHGSPGIGKSDIVLQVARQFNLQVIDLRLSQCDPTDLNGFPTITGERAGYKPMDTFPLEGDELPEGKDGWLLFLDEMNSAPTSVQAAAYKITLDKAVGNKKLHPNVAIICAGNLETDGAIVNRLSTATQSRLVHMELQPDSKDWIEWAQNNDIDYRITSYIGFRPKNLHLFDPDHSDKTFACPRTWAFASRLIRNWDSIPYNRVNLLAGVIGEGPANEFYQFTKIFDRLPDINKIESSPTSAALPDDPGTLYAMAGVLAENVCEANVSALLKYTDRLPKEFQVITIKDMSRRFPKIMGHDAFMEKATELAQLL
ncbi:ATP-binding protein [Salinimonas marina]|uniref:ATP-binding protein n=1 Tax=Salinimonas marina TaxID=2785918 RepID=A0A7S9DZS7_9ALTE|nr:ATP-binding protein [Salinimonas marina]QPG06938.1 ATP-binding protein [Salinimonas marina]